MCLQFWNIVPLEQLLSQLEVEQSAAVIRRIVKLLVNSFHPTGKGADTQVIGNINISLHKNSEELLYKPDFRACLHGGGGPQVGELTRLSRDYMDRRVSSPA